VRENDLSRISPSGGPEISSQKSANIRQLCQLARAERSWSSKGLAEGEELGSNVLCVENSRTKYSREQKRTGAGKDTPRVTPPSDVGSLGRADYPGTLCVEEPTKG